jgi:hypothetical protein
VPGCQREFMRVRIFFLLMTSIGFRTPLSAQLQDKTIDKIKRENVKHRVMETIRRKPDADTLFNDKSEEVFLPYRGKIIRSIEIERIGFERTVQDTARTIRNFFSKAGNTLHTTSREWIIRDNLFIREGKALNPYRLADNERYLRDLDFILDSRIFVYPVSPNSDSVDILVVARDVFGFGAALDPVNANTYRFKIQNSNVLGMGQRLQYTGVVQTNRTPIFGQELIYRKNNMLGTFVDGTLGYTEINNGRSLGNENETAYFFRLDRPLFMPFARWAGGLEVSRNFSKNVFKEPESEFASYQYSLQDYWVGYSFGAHHRQTEKFMDNRHRVFIAGRFFSQDYSTYPATPIRELEKLVYENRTAFLTQATWYRQDFYKTKFIYGFGRTEDVPYGYSVSLTTGWERQALQNRPYLALQGTKTVANRNGNFISIDAKVASYWSEAKSQDVFISCTTSYFSKLYTMQDWSVRHFFDVGYARIFNRTLKNPLDINNGNGIGGFRADSLRGDARLRTRVQAFVFTPLKILGFHFAVVPQLDFALLALSSQSIFDGQLFQGYSLGLRSRNENLVFNTVEIRGHFYPKTVEGFDPVKISVTGNLKIKYPTRLVNAPATVFGD